MIHLHIARPRQRLWLLTDDVTLNAGTAAGDRTKNHATGFNL